MLLNFNVIFECKMSGINDIAVSVVLPLSIRDSDITVTEPYFPDSYLFQS